MLLWDQVTAHHAGQHTSMSLQGNVHQQFCTDTWHILDMQSLSLNQGTQHLLGSMSGYHQHSVLGSHHPGSSGKLPPSGGTRMLAHPSHASAPSQLQPASHRAPGCTLRPSWVLTAQPSRRCNGPNCLPVSRHRTHSTILTLKMQRHTVQLSVPHRSAYHHVLRAMLFRLALTVPAQKVSQLFPRDGRSACAMTYAVAARFSTESIMPILAICHA